MLSPIDATITMSIVKYSVKGVPVTRTPTREPRLPISSALMSVRALTVLKRV